jgi:hypothetical protein
LNIYRRCRLRSSCHGSSNHIAVPEVEAAREAGTRGAVAMTVAAQWSMIHRRSSHGSNSHAAVGTGAAVCHRTVILRNSMTVYNFTSHLKLNVLNTDYGLNGNEQDCKELLYKTKTLLFTSLLVLVKKEYSITK